MDKPMIPRLLLVLSLLLPCLGAARAEDIPPNCPAGSGDCGLAESGLDPYNVILIGHPLKTLDDNEMRALYKWAKARMWKDFPDNEADYLDRNRVMLMPTSAPGKYVFIHLAKVSHDPEFFVPASLIRYTPRAMPESYYPDGRPIHSVLAGCIAVLCTAGDAACFREYPTGMFRFNDGVELDPATKKPLPGGRIVDPVSLRERGQAMRERNSQNQPDERKPKS
ncbi:MAG: hypothetical protein LBF50_00440 [Azoarcus sp.]|nr:hypothetical protein [Azoarcus sp.]